MYTYDKISEITSLNYVRRFRFYDTDQGYSQSIIYIFFSENQIPNWYGSEELRTLDQLVFFEILLRYEL